MSDSTQSVSEQELHAYADGELDAQRRLEVEAWLATHPDAASKLRDYQLIQARLHARFDSVLSEPVDMPLPVRAYPLSRVVRVAAVLVLMLVSVLSGWSLKTAQDTAPLALVMADLVKPATFAHQIYSSDVRYPVEIHAPEQALLNRWVSQRMHTELSAPDLSRQGLTLIGGRLLPSTNRMAAQFMYEDANGQRLTVYVRRIADPEGINDFRYREQDGLHVFFWVDQEMGYAVIGAQPASRLMTVAGAVQAAFRSPSEM
ncbi:Transmembrane regulator protein PrtR [hydrothermal vent metagenome]|uniref:Transmembrane regulator protein PrtR n=1 Tax=hydrothermal vent metagenome TaxID=652676 RepID=A0A3B0ZBM9_9ZZZZ